MSDYPELTPADVADYDQVYASTTAYLDVLVKTQRALMDQGISRPMAVVALAEQLVNPDPATSRQARFKPADIAQLLAVAVDRLEPGWPA